MESLPLVSIIVITRDRCRELLHCLRSLATQTYCPIEVVVLDNGSADGSADAVAREFPDISVIRMPGNYGDWEGRDIALANCRGEYVLCMDDDAWAAPDVVAILVERMTCEPELAVVQAKVQDPEGEHVFGTGLGESAMGTSHYRAQFLGGAAVYRRDYLVRAGGFPHYLLGGAELHLAFRFLDMGYRIRYEPAAIINHRYAPGGRVARQRFYLGNKQRLRAYMNHLPGFWRPLVEYSVKMSGFLAGSLRHGYLANIPLDVLRLTAMSVRERLRRWPMRPESVNLFDYLQCHVVTSPEQYVAIPTRVSHFREMVRRRLGRVT